MNDIQAIDHIKEIIATHTGTDPTAIDPAAYLDGLGADSLDTIAIIMDLENAFEIEISEDEASRVATVNDVIRVVRHLVGKLSAE